MADRFSAGEARVTHDQNVLLPWVHAEDLHALWFAAREAGFASANVHLLTDMIACPGGDFCALANARSIPVAEAITERYQDLDELDDLGEIDLHISGCINSCGHHHSGHIGILGVDKDGSEWYQVTVAGSDGSTISGPAVRCSSFFMLPISRLTSTTLGLTASPWLQWKRSPMPKRMSGKKRSARKGRVPMTSSAIRRSTTLQPACVE